MTKSNILYEGKAKILYETNVSNELIQFFKDDATALIVGPLTPSPKLLVK